MGELIEVTFKCTQNDAALMMAFYAIITNENPDDSVIGPDYFGWIVDELGERAAAYGDYIVNASGQDVPGGLSELIESYSIKEKKS